MIDSLLIRSLPKVELHRHLEGSVRGSTLCSLLRASDPAKFGPLADDQLKSLVQIRSPDTLSNVLSRFMSTQALLSSAEVVERIAFEVVEDAWNDNIVLLELRYSPGFICLGHNNLTMTDAHLAVVRGVRRALELDHVRGRMCVGLIGIVDRHLSWAEKAEEMDVILRHARDFVAVDLANEENEFDPVEYEGLVNLARGEGLRVTVHAGEGTSPSPVLGSIEHLGAERIGHGVAIASDPAAMREVASKDVLLEISLTSNVFTSVASSYETHQLRALLDSNVKVALCTDDPGIFGEITLSQEYELAARHCAVTIDELKAMNRNAFQKSFCKDKQQVAHHFS
jgi:adenosine deaminase